MNIQFDFVDHVILPIPCLGILIHTLLLLLQCVCVVTANGYELRLRFFFTLLPQWCKSINQWITPNCCEYLTHTLDIFNLIIPFKFFFSFSNIVKLLRKVMTGCWSYRPCVLPFYMQGCSLWYYLIDSWIPSVSQKGFKCLLWLILTTLFLGALQEGPKRDMIYEIYITSRS